MLYLEALENRLLLSITISPEDFIVDFPDTAVGRTSEETITITNDGPDPVHISQPSLSGDPDFSLEDVAALQLPAQADEIVQIPYNQQSDVYTINTNLNHNQDHNFYYFEADEGSLVSVVVTPISGSGGGPSPWDTEMLIHTQYGYQIAWNDDIHTPTNRGSQVTFAAPYTGRYYVELYSYAESSHGNCDITIFDTNKTPGNLTLAEAGQTVFGILETEYFRNDYAWYQFYGDYGNKVEVGLTAGPGTILQVYNSFGKLVLEGQLMTDSDSFDLALYRSGQYYLKLESDWNYGTGKASYELTITETDSSIFDLDDGETIEIPIWFSPQNGGARTADLTIETNAEGGTHDVITLNGYGIPSDITVSELSLPELAYPSYVQSGRSLSVSAVVSNASVYDALLLSRPILQFYLSEDSSLDTAEDTLLTATTATSGSFPLYPGANISLSSVVNIPDVPADSYCLFAVVNGDMAIGETNYNNNQTAPYPIYVDPYNTLILDSSGDRFDYRIDYGTKAIGYNVAQQTVTVYNRGNEPVTITDWSLACGVDFTLDNKNAAGNSADNIILQPGQSRNVLIRFTANQFGSGGQDTFNDIVTINTSETSYKVDLGGTITGDDLLVLEDSGTTNDNLLELGVVSVNVPVKETFTLKNNGDQTLRVNSITFANGAMSLLKLAEDPLNPLNLPLELVPGQSVEMEVVLAAPDYRIGDYSDNIVIRSTDKNGAYTCQLGVSATITRYELGIYETSDIPNDAVLRFGSHSLQQPEPATETVQLRNDGLANLTLSSFVFGGSNFAISSAQLFNQTGLIADIDISAGNIILAPYASAGAYLKLDIQCAAKAEGSFVDTLTVSSEAGNDKITMSCQIAAGQLVITDSSDSLISATRPLTLNAVVHEYGNTSLSTSNWFYISNISKVNINLTDISIVGTGFSLSTLGSAGTQKGTTITFNSGEQVLSRGAKTRIAVNFDGTEMDPGSYSGSITINGSLTNALSFEAVSSVTIPDINLSSSSINVGSGLSVNIGETLTSQLVISNTNGTADLIINNWNSSNSQFALGIDTPLVIPSGQIRNVQVAYTPTTPGLVHAALTINSNDPDTPAAVVTLAGLSDGRPLEVDGNSYSFHDEDGDLVRISLSDGNMVIYLEGGKRDNADIALLELSDTTSKSQLRINNTGQTNIAVISNVTSAEGLASIIAPAANLGQALLINGSLGTLTLKNIESNATVTVLQSAAKAMTIKADQIAENVAFNLQSDVKTFQANSFTSGSFSAVAIDQVKISKGTFGADLNAATINKITSQGDITGDINTTGSINSIASTRGGIKQNTILVGGSIKTINAKTDISGNIIVQNDIDLIDVKYGSFSGAVRARNINCMNARDLDNALISTANDINTIKVKFDIIDSNILAGYDIGMSSNLLDTGDDDLSAGHINLLSFGGDYRNSYTTAGAMTDNIYINLYSSLHSGFEHSVGSAGIAKIQGKNIISGNNNTEFGFYASGSINTALAGSADFVVMQNYNPDSET